MKHCLFTCLLWTSLCAVGDAVEKDAQPLLQQYSVKAPKVLEQPFVGTLPVVHPKDHQGDDPEQVRLNLLRPADGGKGHSPIDSPYLATSDDGRSYWGAFALRRALPTTAQLSAFSDYQEIVKFLGDPTHLPFSGQTDENWAYDSVSWRLFVPLDADTIDVVEVTVARKSRFEDDDDISKYVIEDYQVRRAKLTRNKQGDAGSSATATEVTAGGAKDLKPEPTKRSR